MQKDKHVLGFQHLNSHRSIALDMLMSAVRFSWHLRMKITFHNLVAAGPDFTGPLRSGDASIPSMISVTSR